MIDAKVSLWGTRIGAVSWLDENALGVFQYDPDFLHSGIQLSPLMMPLKEYPYQFPELSRITFRGLPGLLADSLPDKFGNAVIDAWLASQGRTPQSFNSVERLCTIGKRGMGGLEYEPVILRGVSRERSIKIAELVELSNEILNQRTALNGKLSGGDDQKAMEDILRVGTSAGGARAKAILAWNPVTNEFRSGQITHPSDSGFHYWILKFDGITNNRDKELADPQGYGKIEYAYNLIAREIGIEMTECRLHHENGRSHFMTKRFDRTDDGQKIHMQTLGALAHLDYNQPASYSYEQAVQTMKLLDLTQPEFEQFIFRAMFNVIGRNQDDHVKNIAFLMDQKGRWRLSPAYDMNYAYDPKGAWTNYHQMSINGKRDQFTLEDLTGLARLAGIKFKPACAMLDKVKTAFEKWPLFAEIAGVEMDGMEKIQSTFQLVRLDDR